MVMTGKRLTVLSIVMPPTVLVCLLNFLNLMPVEVEQGLLPLDTLDPLQVV
jgi:hypothetical protein